MKNIENISGAKRLTKWLGRVKKRIKLLENKYIIIEMRNSTDKGDLWTGS